MAKKPQRKRGILKEPPKLPARRGEREHDTTPPKPRDPSAPVVDDTPPTPEPDKDETRASVDAGEGTPPPEGDSPVGDNGESGDETDAEPQPNVEDEGEDDRTLPTVGSGVMFHSKLRRAGLRGHAPAPAVVTAVRDGKLSLTVFLEGAIRYVNRIDADKRKDEHWSRPRG